MMNRNDELADPRGHGLDEELREVLGGADQITFDYDALVAGTKARAGRIRRRQAMARGVVAVVLVPTLAGAGWVLSGTLTGPDGGSVDLASQTGTDEVVTTHDAPATTDDAPATMHDAPATTDDAPVTTEGSGGPPFQDPELLPPITFEEPNPEWPNRWTVPDARPTGVSLLDTLGSPRSASQYPREPPLTELMVVPGDGGGVEPHSASSAYFFAGGNELDQDSVMLTVTAWDDSTAVMASLRSGDPITLARWAPGAQQVPWSGRTDADHLLLEDRGSELPRQLAGALVRQGDYLVGVSVRARTQEEARAAAAEIAEKTAANLAFLDPERAGT